MIDLNLRTILNSEDGWMDGWMLACFSLEPNGFLLWGYFGRDLRVLYCQLCQTRVLAAICLGHMLGCHWLAVYLVYETLQLMAWAPIKIKPKRGGRRCAMGAFSTYPTWFDQNTHSDSRHLYRALGNCLNLPILKTWRSLWEWMWLISYSCIFFKRLVINQLFMYFLYFYSIIYDFIINIIINVVAHVITH